MFFVIFVYTLKISSWHVCLINELPLALWSPDSFVLCPIWPWPGSLCVVLLDKLVRFYTDLSLTQDFESSPTEPCTKDEPKTLENTYFSVPFWVYNSFRCICPLFLITHQIYITITLSRLFSCTVSFDCGLPIDFDGNNSFVNHEAQFHFNCF